MHTTKHQMIVAFNYLLFYNRMGATKWCQFCRINIPYNKKDIQEHQQTRLHLSNKQKTIKYQRIKIQQEQKAKRQDQKQNAFLSSANIPKAKRGSQLEKEVHQYRNAVMNSGKSAIHQLIAQKTKGAYGAPIQYPNKEDLVLAQNYDNPIKNKDKNSDASDSQEQFQMWRMDICEQTGNPCFINAITKAKYYQPPKGYIMSQSKKEQWSYLIEICKQKQNTQDNQVNISQWQQVPDEQNYFQVNKVIQSQKESQDEVKKEETKGKRGMNQRSQSFPDEGIQKPKNWVQQLQEKINNNLVDGNQVMQTVIYHKLLLCKSVKERNETLKTLIRNDIEIRQTLDQQIIKEELFGQQDRVAVSFKPKKKRKMNKLEQGDI